MTNITAKARNEHPIQSHMAADSKNKSNTLSADRLAVLGSVSTCPGQTAKWYDNYINLDGKAHRRAPELDDLGLIRRDKSGREMKLYITEAGREELNRE